jgi:hypothetical protein
MLLLQAFLQHILCGLHAFATLTANAKALFHFPHRGHALGNVRADSFISDSFTNTNVHMNSGTR